MGTRHAKVEINILKDFDRKWTSHWPADLVAAGGSPGAGRHETRKELIAAIEARGWTVTRNDGTWTAETSTLRVRSERSYVPLQ